MAAKLRWTPARKKKFLKLLQDSGGNVSRACRDIGLSSRGAYKMKDRNKAFSDQWDEIAEAGTDDLIEEARRRAYHGIDKPIYHQGFKVDTIKEYSDTLLIFMIKAKRPEYKDKTDIRFPEGLTVKIQKFSVKEGNKNGK